MSLNVLLCSSVLALSAYVVIRGGNDLHTKLWYRYSGTLPSPIVQIHYTARRELRRWVQLHEDRLLPVTLFPSKSSPRGFSPRSTTWAMLSFARLFDHVIEPSVWDSWLAERPHLSPSGLCRGGLYMPDGLSSTGVLRRGPFN